MPEKSLTLLIKTPDKILYQDQEILSLRLPLIDGSLGIRPGHAELIAQVSPGKIEYLKENSEEFQQVEITEGILCVENDNINILSLNNAHQNQSLTPENELDAISDELIKLLYEQTTQDEINGT